MEPKYIHYRFKISNNIYNIDVNFLKHITLGVRVSELYIFSGKPSAGRT